MAILPLLTLSTLALIHLALYADLGKRYAVGYTMMPIELMLPLSMLSSSIAGLETLIGPKLFETYGMEACMAATAFGAKTIGMIKGAAPHCAECGAISSITGKGLSFGLGIGLGSALPFIFVAGGLYFASRLMKKHLCHDIIMHTDQNSQ